MILALVGQAFAKPPIQCNTEMLKPVNISLFVKLFFISKKKRKNPHLRWCWIWNLKDPNGGLVTKNTIYAAIFGQNRGWFSRFVKAIFVHIYVKP